MASTDGATIMFTNYDGRGDTVWLINADGTNPRRTENTARYIDEIAWSPDSTRIANTTYSQGSGSGLRVGEADGEVFRDITGDHDRANANPQWSADSQRLVFVSDRTGNYEIWEMNPDTGESHRLTNTPGDESTPQWSPDGQRGIYILEGDLWVMDADGSAARQLTNTPADESSPQWSPDGLSVVYTVYEDEDFDVWGDKPRHRRIPAVDQQSPIGALGAVVARLAEDRLCRLPRDRGRVGATAAHMGDEPRRHEPATIDRDRGQHR